ncbi:MDR family MFS transporter [Microlunatus sp. GCM10028923]|uniref:MDR family MFS transporter n=1 Tax=Microlunatus sp. GCM10028923 TaxID=3273400 RepID=UPI00361EA887
MVQPEITRASVGLRSERGPVLLSVMLSAGLVAIDSTILATAVPAIVDDLGGFSQFPWLFSVYLLAQAVAVPIYGKLADIIGRKAIMLFGIGAFVLGSVLCGLAWSMPALIAFRAVQGLGAGAVQPMGMTIIGDIYTLAERAKVQGYLASVWAISAVVGPTLGGLFVDFLNWRWIFFVNVPLGAVAVWMLVRKFTEQLTRTKHKIDFAGAILLTVGGSLLIFGLLEGGVLWPWISWPSAAVLGGAVLLLISFGLVERKAAEPILPGWIFTRRILNGANLVSLTVGVILIGLTSYVPLFAQGVLDTSALVAGFALAAMTIGWPLAASNSGRLYLRIGFRNTGLIGSVLVLAGAGLLLTLAAGGSIWVVALTCFLIGLGMGLIASPSLIAAQSTVGWQHRGVVTGANMFARSMGSAIGIAVFGAIANASLAGKGAIGSHGSTSSDVPPEVLAPAIHQVFFGSAVFAVLLVIAVLIIPRKIETDASAQ